MVRHTSDAGAHARARRRLTFLADALAFAVVAAVAWAVWPASLGGATTFIIVDGSSMEPRFHSGDLVVARVGTPAVGDVVVYRPDGFDHALIVHQIVGGDGADGWVMQGENNTWTDPWRPTNADVVGVVHSMVPRLGSLTMFLVSPILWGCVLALAAALLLWPEKPDDGDLAAGGAGAAPAPKRHPVAA